MKLSSVIPDYRDPLFSQAVISWQKQHGRHSLPWQQTSDAYRVWLSEIMLQQTQVAAVIPYYQRFLQRCPTVHDLAAAPSEDVMALWAGLGYYTRARNLHACAKQVVARYQGRFPSDPALLQELPGIGRSTAAAVAAFSYGTVAAILDGNVKRVFARVFGIAEYPGKKSVEDDLWLRAQALLPAQEIAAYTQGLMDLGATICTRNQARCGECPLQRRCVAYANGRVAELPVRKPKKAPREKHAIMLVVQAGDEVLLEQRPNTGIWGGLLSLPELYGMREGMLPPSEQGLHPDPYLLERERAVQTWLAQFGEAEQIQSLPVWTHVFTHFKLFAHVIHCRLARKPHLVAQSSLNWVKLDQAAALALPAPIKTLLSAF